MTYQASICSSKATFFFIVGFMFAFKPVAMFMVSFAVAKLRFAILGRASQRS